MAIPKNNNPNPKGVPYTESYTLKTVTTQPVKPNQAPPPPPPPPKANNKGK